jgi:hypothetical protein
MHTIDGDKNLVKFVEGRVHFVLGNDKSNVQYMLCDLSRRKRQNKRREWQVRVDMIAAACNTGHFTG